MNYLQDIMDEVDKPYPQWYEIDDMQDMMNEIRNLNKQLEDDDE